MFSLRKEVVLLEEFTKIAASQLNSLKIPPNNRLGKLKGKRSGQYSIRINEQWRICFVWKRSDAYDTEIVDYH